MAKALFKVDEQKLRLALSEFNPKGSLVKEYVPVDGKPIPVELSGESLWGDETGVANVTKISILMQVYEEHADGIKREADIEAAVQNGNGWCLIYVYHNRVLEIYTDNAFEKGISKLLGADVMFTEYGMQEDHIASMEC